jgi:hypothetical protein
MTVSSSARKRGAFPRVQTPFVIRSSQKQLVRIAALRESLVVKGFG